MFPQLKSIALKTAIITIVLFAFSLNAKAQEWKNLKSYQKETGNTTLQEACWLKKDRKKQTAIWKQANTFNLKDENGYSKYKTISQIRDFYIWFDKQRQEQGHEIQWFGIAAVVSKQLSNLDSGFIRFFIVRNKEVVHFGNEGSKKVFEYAYPKMKFIYFSETIIKGEKATSWSSDYGMKEQCEILEPLYEELSPKALNKLDRMAKGKGIYCFAVSKYLRYEGSVENCEVRYQYGIKKVLPFYLKLQSKE